MSVKQMSVSLLHLYCYSTMSIGTKREVFNPIKYHFYSFMEKDMGLFNFFSRKMVKYSSKNLYILDRVQVGKMVN